MKMSGTFYDELSGEIPYFMLFCSMLKGVECKINA